MTTAMATAPKISLRPYQQAAVDAVYDHLRRRDDNPCVVIPTAGGKTPIMATICRDVVQLWSGRVLILAHVKELLEQAVEKLHTMAPDLFMQIGAYSAGLKSRDTNKPIIVAGIQSAFRRAAELGHFDIILADECHLLPPDGEGMYRTFLADARVVNPHVRLIGLTATPYRMATGEICGPENLLNHICYEVGVRELITQGYLCPLKSKAGKQKVDTSNLHVRGGEFVAGEVEALMDNDTTVRAACREIVDYAQNRHAVLIFAAGVQHAQHVQQILTESGCECGFVCGDTSPTERAATLERFKSGGLKFLVNVNVLTTGFDAPNIDCVALLRPTNSPGLYYQMVGRGFRLHPSKTDCLVLDFGGNILRHGPVDALQVKRPGAAGTGEAPAKECPECQTVVHAACSHCPDCGYEFPAPEQEKHDRTAATNGILTGQVGDDEVLVTDVYYRVHTKRDAPDNAPRTMRVEYRVGWNRYISEWVCFEHTGFARNKAVAWWKARSNEPVPATAEEAVAICNAGGVAPTLAITIRHTAGEKYPRIVKHQLGDKPSLASATLPDTEGDLAGPEPEYIPAWPEDEVPF